MGLFRKTFRLGLLAGIGYGVWRAVQGRRATSSNWPATSWETTSATGGMMPATSATTASRNAPAPVAPTARPAAGRPPKPPARTGPARKAPTGRAEDPPGERLWVQANEGVCPPTHPVKAKLSSKIFHTPGSPHYSRTHADRCYPDEQSAVADGMRPPRH